MNTKQKVLALEYHRNGICGQGFHVAIVDETEGGERRQMLVIRFPKECGETTGLVTCAAFDLAQLDQRQIGFGFNSWRGDHYNDVVDAAIEREKVI